MLAAGCALALFVALQICPSVDSESVLHLKPHSDADFDHVLNLLNDWPHLDVLHASRGVDGASISIRGDDKLASELRANLAHVPHTITKRSSFDDIAELFRPRSRRDDGIFRSGQDLRTFEPNKYYRNEDIINFVDQAKEQFGDRVQKFTIGRSHEGRKIYLLKISAEGGSSPLKKAVFVDAGIHPREWISPATALHLIWTLLTQSRRNAAAKRLLQAADVFVAPNLNPDGYEFTWNFVRYWRKNRGPERCSSRCCAIGADINRNFPFHYGVSGSSRHPCDETFKGNGSLSEPEARALASALRSLKDRVLLYATLHSFGQTVLVPYGYAAGAHADNYEHMMDVAGAGVRAMSMLHGAAYSVLDSANLCQLTALRGASASKCNGTGDADPAAGGSDDWARGSLGIPYAYTIELRPNPANGQIRLRHFSPPASQVTPSGEELLAGLDAMWTRIEQLRRQ